MRMWSVVLVGLVSLACGCAAGFKELEIPEEEAVYDAPLEEIWPGVRQFFTDHRLSFREDPGNFRLQTEWREEFGGSRVAGFWHRYLVVGQRETPTRAKVWVIRVTRSANQTLSRAGRELDWGINRAVGSGGGGGEASSGAPGGSMLSIEDLADNTDKPVGDIAIMNGSAQSSRDLVMEWKVHRAVAPRLAKQEPAAPKTQTLSLPVPLPSLAVECGQSIIGLYAQAKAGHVLLLGELHGTQEVPRFVAQAACQSASNGLPVTVGLELPVEHQERVAAFVRSAGTPEDLARLLEADFWRNPYADGRSSEAIVNVLEQLRRLRAQGQDVDVFVFDHPLLKGQPHEDRMAGTVLARLQAEPQRLFLVVTGNIHARTTRGVPWDKDFQPMGARVAQAHPTVVGLDVAYASGTAWICSVEGARQKLVCGERPAKGKDNGDRFFVHLFGKRSRDGYHGVFYVGPITASPPAVR